MALAVIENTKYFVSGSYQNIKIWNHETGQLIKTIATGHPYYIWGISQIPKTTDIFAVSGSESNGFIGIYNITSGENLKKIYGPTNGFYQIDIIPGTELLVAAGYDGNVYIYNSTTWELFKKLVGHTGRVLAIKAIPNSDFIASGSYDGDKMVKIWNYKTGSLIFNLQDDT